MDSFSGYKLKPSSYSIQPNDIIIRVRAGISGMPNGQIAIALGKEYVKTYTKQSWSTCYHEWRAIETRSGSEAKIGDTVYCIDYPGGDCQVHDSFIVSDIKKHKFLGPQQGHRLLNGKIVGNAWCWPSNDFVVLVKAEEKEQTQNIVSPEDAKPGDYVIWNSANLTSMTLGKAYEVVTVHNTSLIIRNNQDKEDLWSKSRFKSIDKDQKQQEEASSTDKPLDSIEKLLKSVASTIPITTVSIGSMMPKPTQTKPSLKGKQMNTNLFTDILKLLAQAEQTDLQKAPSTYAFFYNNEGEYEGTARVANESEAKALLQKPEHLGYTMRIYSFSDEFTTQIPVVSTIKKTIVAKPAIKPTRKTKATEVA